MPERGDGNSLQLPVTGYPCGPIVVTAAIDTDTAFDGLPGSLYLLDITENNDEVWRMAQKLGCSYMTHVAFGW